MQDATVPAMCQQVMRLFPPTTLGHFDSKDLSYNVEFPSGIRMKFTTSSPEVFEQIRSRSEHPGSESKTSPVLKLLEVFRSNSGTKPDNAVASVEIFPLEGIRFKSPGATHYEWLPLNSSIQDVISVLGSPDDSYGSLLNFFNWGIDVKFEDGTFGMIEKLILHFNQPGHPFFGRYRKVSYSVVDNKKTKRSDPPIHSANNFLHFHELRKSLGDPGPPIVVTHQDSGTVRRLFNFGRGLFFDVSESGLAALEICR